LIVNHHKELFFVLTRKEKDGKIEMWAELPGGKTAWKDFWMSKWTAIREMKEETGINLTGSNLKTKLITTGGPKTGMPSIQWLTEPMMEQYLNGNGESKFVECVYSKIHFIDGKYYVLIGVNAGVNAVGIVREIDVYAQIRKYNTFIFEQHKEGELKPFIEIH